jgi:sulfite reductase (NADPH) hemoprotein beta-component
MATIDDPTVLGRARLTFANEAEIDEFAQTLARFEAGEIGPDQWRAFRLVRGTYGQRQAEDAQMLRVKIPQGILSQAQLHAMADVAVQYSRGFGHITTRQNVQFHFIRLHDVELAMRRLAVAGLTTREACGNSVRNITACPYAGVAADEAFDVTPYSEALTRYFLRHPLAAVLPRKFKIAFEGCLEDHALVSIHDIGWRALIRGNNGTAERGFRVTVGGGTATMCRSGFLLHEFLPVTGMFECAEAIVRVFHRLGDYKHKHKNRMKFLIKALGWERYREEYELALAEVRREGPRPLPFNPDRPPEEAAPDWTHSRPQPPAEIARRVDAESLHGPGIHPDKRGSLRVVPGEVLLWQRRNVRPQRQRGYVIATVSLPLGDLTAEQFRVAADLAAAYGDGTVRVTIDQDFVFRWVRVEALEALYARLAAAGLAVAEGGSPANVTSCPGAESCRLAVTQSRGLGRLLHDDLAARPDLADTARGLTIKMSGCPNGCGQHHIANIGFQGSIRKLDGRAVPQYFVMVGGGSTDAGATFGRVAAKIPARRAPAAVERLVNLYTAERYEGETPTAFFQRAPFERVKGLLADLEPLSLEEATPEDFIDLGETTAFVPEVMDGECSA